MTTQTKYHLYSKSKYSNERIYFTTVSGDKCVYAWQSAVNELKTMRNICELRGLTNTTYHSESIVQGLMYPHFENNA